jgi:hypothetical protein
MCSLYHLCIEEHLGRSFGMLTKSDSIICRCDVGLGSPGAAIRQYLCSPCTAGAISACRLLMLTSPAVATCAGDKEQQGKPHVIRQTRRQMMVMHK